MTDKPIAAPGEPMISCDACRKEGEKKEKERF